MRREHYFICPANIKYGSAFSISNYTLPLPGVSMRGKILLKDNVSKSHLSCLASVTLARYAYFLWGE